MSKSQLPAVSQMYVDKRIKRIEIIERLIYLSRIPAWKLDEILKILKRSKRK